MHSSHLVSDLERVCDHLIVLVASRVRVAGDVAELLAGHLLLTGSGAPAAIPPVSTSSRYGAATGRPRARPYAGAELPTPPGPPRRRPWRTSSSATCPPPGPGCTR